MTTSTVIPSASASDWTFEDSHLTLKQKNDFWTFKISANFNGKHYEGTMLELSHSPELAKEIDQQYKLFCKNQLELKLQQAQDLSINAERGTRTDDSVASKNNSTSDTSFTASTLGAEKYTFSTAQVHPTCEDPTRIFCVCNAPLNDTDDYYCEECRAFFILAAKTCEYESAIQGTTSPESAIISLTTPSLKKKNTNPSDTPDAPTDFAVQPSYKLGKSWKEVSSATTSDNLTPSPRMSANTPFAKLQSSRPASRQIIDPTFCGNATTTTKPTASRADVSLSWPTEINIATPPPERGVDPGLVNAQSMLSGTSRASLFTHSCSPAAAAKLTPSPTKPSLHMPTVGDAMKPSSNKTNITAKPEANAAVRLNYIPSEISLLTPPPSSSPTIDLATPLQNIIDLTRIDTTPVPTNYLSSPASSMTNQTAKPEKKGRQRYPRAECSKCRQEFAISLKKNDGVTCTKCTRKVERGKELEVKPVSAVESLDVSTQPVAPVAVMSPTTIAGAALKRKATSDGATDDKIAPSPNKRMRVDTPVRAMGILEDEDDVVAKEMANMTPEEKMYYGLAGFGW